MVRSCTTRASRRGCGETDTPQEVIRGAGVGEASQTADGQFLYFVRVYVDGASQVYDADVYCLQKATYPPRHCHSVPSSFFTYTR